MGTLNETIENDEIVYELTAKGFLRLLAKDAGADTISLANDAMAIQSGAYTFVLDPKNQTYYLHLTSEVEFHE